VPDFAELDQQTLAVYRAILLHRETEHGRLAARLGLPEAAVTAAVDRLIALALLAPSWEQPDRLRAVSPAAGMEILLRREQALLAAHQRRIDQDRAALAALAAEFSAQGHGSGHGDIEHVRGIDEIRTRLESLAGSATHECLAFHPDGALTSESIEAGKPLNEHAIARGVRFRTMYLSSFGNDRTTRDYARWMSERGSEIRTAPTLPMRLLIVDGATAVVAGPREESRPTALVLHSPPVVSGMHALFESYWANATPLGTRVSPSADTLVPEERELLRMLASGMTDDAAARALGVSVRTERRIMADLMIRLEASSRFEAGVKAAQRNWV
jgi:DNA-binding CsgD family transcriptional regulator